MPPPEYTQPPEDHTEFDEHQMLVFRKSMPWWIRPTRRSTDLTVHDLIGHTRDAFSGAIGELDVRMGKIFADTSSRRSRAFGGSMSYRIGRDSASYVKSGYGTESYLQFMRESFSFTKTARRFGIPHGDPLYGKHGNLTREKASGRMIYVDDLSTEQNKLMQWLMQSSRIEDVFAQPQMDQLREGSGSARVILYMKNLRQQIWDIVGNLTQDDYYKPGWREECVGLAIEELVKVAGDRQQAAVNELLGKNADKPFFMSATEVVQQFIRPNTSDTKQAEQALSLLEQMFAMNAEERNVEALKAFVAEWNKIMEALDLAPNERPTGGLATLMVKCAVDSPDEVRRWIGPKEA